MPEFNHGFDKLDKFRRIDRLHHVRTMVWYSPFPLAMPSDILDVTADFAPLCVGLTVGLGFCLLLLAVATGEYDTWAAKHTAMRETDAPPSFPKAA